MSTPSEPLAVGPADPDEPMTVTLIVRPRRDAPADADAQAEALAATPIADRQYASREAFAQEHGADPRDLSAVAAFAHRHGLHVAESDASRRRVVLSGRASDFASTFGVRLERFQGPSGPSRGTTDPILIPPELQPMVETILGLDDRPAAHPRT